MIRTIALIALLYAQADVAGGWAVTITVPRGELNYRMFIVQKGTRLSGYVLSESGQFELEGTINGNQLKFGWTVPDGGQLVPISFSGKVENELISGTAKVGNVGVGPLVAERN